MRELQSELAKYEIEIREISISEAEDKSGTRMRLGKGGSIWEVTGDGSLAPNIVDILTEGIRNNGGLIIESRINNIFCNKNERRVTGITFDKGISDGFPREGIIKTNSLYTSFGARARYRQDAKLSGEIERPEAIISGTGYSAYLLIEGEITKPIDSNNSHFTPIQSLINRDGKIVTIIKATCGAVIGFDGFAIDHAFNNLFYASVIFPNREIEIIAAKSCARPLNSKNSGKLTEVAGGFYVATGFGGKGVTDAAKFAWDFTNQAIEKDSVPVMEKYQAKKKLKKYLQENDPSFREKILSERSEAKQKAEDLQDKFPKKKAQNFQELVESEREEKKLAAERRMEATEGKGVTEGESKRSWQEIVTSKKDTDEKTRL